MLMRFTRLISLLLLAIFASTTLAQTQYPGAGIFSVECLPAAINFYREGNLITQVSFGQIANPLAVAVATRQNQPISVGAEVGIWALQSDELQIHLNIDPDNTRLVFRSDYCGVIPRPTAGEALAYALAIAYGGYASAAAQVNGCHALAIAEVNGPGVAIAYAQSTGCQAAVPGGRVHVVQAGENLFRISLRYGTTVSTLAALNNIADPTLIFVGQVLQLP